MEYIKAYIYKHHKTVLSCIKLDQYGENRPQNVCMHLYILCTYVYIYIYILYIYIICIYLYTYILHYIQPKFYEYCNRNDTQVSS